MTEEAKVMRIASSTKREVKMKTWLMASVDSRPTTAMPPQAMPVAHSSHTNMSRQVLTRTSPLGWARNLRQAAIMQNFMAMTAASHTEACTTGAQNMEASEKMRASSGRVMRAESSLLMNIASSSYSNSGLTPPGEGRARSSRICRSGAARRLGQRGGGAELVASAPCIVSSPIRDAHCRQGLARASARPKANLEAHRLIEVYQPIDVAGGFGSGAARGGAQASPCTLNSAPLPLFKMSEPRGPR